MNLLFLFARQSVLCFLGFFLCIEMLDYAAAADSNDDDVC